ncbi:MAG: DUF92 domain-containing protein [Methanomicrobiales archaeon]|nr:DUF92 domain-containing protein [Methanomicrobiales archaeon]
MLMLRQPALWGAWMLAILFILVAPHITPGWVLSLVVILFSCILFLIPETHYASISLIIIAALYGTGWLPLFIFLSTVAIMVTGELAFRTIGESSYGYVAYTLAGIVSSFVVMLYLGHIVPLIALLGIIVAVMLKSALMKRTDLLLIEGLGVAMTMYFFDQLHYQVELDLLLLAVIMALAFGIIAKKLGAADMSGLFSGALLGVILVVFADVRWFFIMLLFFVMGSVATKYKYREKAASGSAQAHGGVRGYFNVFANGLVGVSAAILFGLTRHPMFTAMYLGAVATAAADTVAGEIGMTCSTPFLITTGERVSIGTNGGVTAIGEIAGLVASFAIVALALIMEVSSLPMMLICGISGFLGTNVDSLIGATIENRGLIGNAGTNLLATLFGGLFAMLFFIV